MDFVFSGLAVSLILVAFVVVLRFLGKRERSIASTPTSTTEAWDADKNVSFRDVAFSQTPANDDVSGPVAIDPVDIGYGRWFDRAKCQVWKRTLWQEAIDGTDSILYLTEDKKWVFKEPKYQNQYTLWDDKAAWDWFLATRFRNRIPSWLVEKMLKGKV